MRAAPCKGAVTSGRTAQDEEPTVELHSMSKTKRVPEKTTLVLSNLHNAWLDEVSIAIRRGTGAAISRSALVRATIWAMCEAGVDLSTCESERAVGERIHGWLRRGRS